MSRIRMRWDVDHETGMAAFEMTCATADQELGSDVSQRFAASLEKAGVRSVTNMLRTRHQVGSVTILWTGEVSDTKTTQSLLQGYEEALHVLA